MASPGHDRRDMEISLKAQDWQRLRALRERYLTDASEEYWTERDLVLYDATFARRIGWKWEAVLADLAQAGWKPRSDRLLDWGVAPGIAERAAATWSGIKSAEISLDQSKVAMNFAVKALQSDGVRAQIGKLAERLGARRPCWCSVTWWESLRKEELLHLAQFAATAEELIWVEPGSREISRRLGSIRAILQAGGHNLIGPCTHQNPCQIFAPENTSFTSAIFLREPPDRAFSVRLLAARCPKKSRSTCADCRTVSGFLPAPASIVAGRGGTADRPPAGS